jgi:hypothetical protein
MRSCDRPSNNSASVFFPFLAVEDVLLLDRDPGQLLPLLRQFLVEVAELLLPPEQLLACRRPFLLRSDLVLRRRVHPLSRCVRCRPAGSSKLIGRRKEGAIAPREPPKMPMSASSGRLLVDGFRIRKLKVCPRLLEVANDRLIDPALAQDGLERA